MDIKITIIEGNFLAYEGEFGSHSTNKNDRGPKWLAEANIG
jgi:hypothetical protein